MYNRIFGAWQRGDEATNEISNHYLKHYLAKLKALPNNGFGNLSISDFKNNLTKISELTEDHEIQGNQYIHYTNAHLQLPFRNSPNWEGEFIECTFEFLDYFPSLDKSAAAKLIPFTSTSSGPAVEFPLCQNAKKEQVKNLLNSTCVYIYANNVQDLMTLKKEMTDFFQKNNSQPPFVILVTTAACKNHLNSIKHLSDIKYKTLFSNVVTMIEGVRREDLDCFVTDDNDKRWIEIDGKARANFESREHVEHLIRQSIMACKGKFNCALVNYTLNENEELKHKNILLEREVAELRINLEIQRRFNSNLNPSGFFSMKLTAPTPHSIQEEANTDTEIPNHQKRHLIS